MDIPYELMPVAVMIEGEWEKSLDKVAVVRHPTHDDPKYRTFGYVAPNYGLMQNVKIGEILDPLTEEWPVETVGMLYQGRTLFLTLKSGTRDIRGDPVDQYFLFTDSKSGTEAARLAFTPIRVVCKNTLVIGMNKAIFKANLIHHKEVAKELEWRTDMLLQMQETQEEVMTDFDKLAAKHITKEQAEAIFEKAYPYPSKPIKLEVAEEANGLIPANLQHIAKRFQSETQMRNRRREEVTLVYDKLNDEIEPTQLAGTAWTAYNAVVEWEDFRGKGSESSLAAALFGDRAAAKKRAFAEALRISA
jgi:phage/plasmid-like protein (TIGR03299 family)